MNSTNTQHATRMEEQTIHELQKMCTQIHIYRKLIDENKDVHTIKELLKIKRVKKKEK